MRKSFTTTVTILTVGMLLLGNTVAQQTPASNPQPAPTVKTQETPTPKLQQTPAAKTQNASKLKTQRDKVSYAIG